MPAIILMLWAVTGLIFIDVFAGFPHQPQAGRGLWGGRWPTRLRQGLRWALLLGFLALGVTVVELSLSIADAWLADRPR